MCALTTLHHAGGLLLPGSSVKGVSLANTLASFEESLDYVPAFTGKGGGRRKGCMINCDGNDTAVGAAEAFLAGECATGCNHMLVHCFCQYAPSTQDGLAGCSSPKAWAPTFLYGLK